jgi:hypothetical protein
MGTGHFQPDDKFNPKGYFEDLQWRYANQRITGRGYSIAAANVTKIGKKQRAIYRNLAREYRTKVLWGMKDPWLCFVGQFVWKILANQGVEVRMVAVYRDLQASTASIRRHIERSYRGKYKYTPCQIADAWQAGFERRLVEFPNQNNLYRVCYERLVDNPRVEIMRLIRFCYEDMPIRWNDNVDQVAEWVTPTLKHF